MSIFPTSIALGVHILLSIDRPDVAQKEFVAARTWADDSLLIQLIEAYLGIYSGGREAQQAYYVYDELAQNPSETGKLSSVPSLTGKAVARIVVGEFAEADAVLSEAAELVSYLKVAKEIRRVQLLTCMELHSCRMQKMSMYWPTKFLLHMSLQRAHKAVHCKLLWQI